MCTSVDAKVGLGKLSLNGEPEKSSHFLTFVAPRVHYRFESFHNEAPPYFYEKRYLANLCAWFRYLAIFNWWIHDRGLHRATWFAKHLIFISWNGLLKHVIAPWRRTKIFRGQTPKFTHFTCNQTHLRNFCLLESPRPQIISFHSLFSLRNFKTLAKTTAPRASWCVCASYVFTSKYLSEASLRFLQRNRENAVL